MSTTSTTPKGDEPSVRPTGEESKQVTPKNTTAQKSTGKQNFSDSSESPAFVKSSWFKVCSWEDPVTSGIIFGSGLMLYFFHSYLAWSLPRTFAGLAILGLLAGAGVKIARDYGNQTHLETLEVPIKESHINSAVTQVGNVISDLVKRTNVLIKWENSWNSGRALSIAWISTCFSTIYNPTTILLAFILAFALAPAYKAYQGDIDKVYSQQVKPQLSNIAEQISATQLLIQQKLQQQGNPAKIGAAVGGLVVFYFVWRHMMRFTTMCNLGALVFLTVDILLTFKTKRS